MIQHKIQAICSFKNKASLITCIKKSKNLSLAKQNHKDESHKLWKNMHLDFKIFCPLCWSYDKVKINFFSILEKQLMLKMLNISIMCIATQFSWSSWLSPGSTACHTKSSWTLPAYIIKLVVHYCMVSHKAWVRTHAHSTDCTTILGVNPLKLYALCMPIYYCLKLGNGSDPGWSGNEGWGLLLLDFVPSNEMFSHSLAVPQQPFWIEAF